MTIALIIIAAVLILLLAGGYVVSRRRIDSPNWAEHVAQADQALEQARASDKGWDRALLEQAARDALGRDRPGLAYDDLHLVLVDDKPGVEEDKAHFVAASREGDVRVVLARDASGSWQTDSVG